MEKIKPREARKRSLRALLGSTVGAVLGCVAVLILAEPFAGYLRQAPPWLGPVVALAMLCLFMLVVIGLAWYQRRRR